MTWTDITQHLPPGWAAYFSEAMLGVIVGAAIVAIVPLLLMIKPR